jgi:Fe2+ or Zn2+ uptake regulation protein
LEDGAEILRKHGLKMTSPRLQILRYLQKQVDHPTADEIYSALKKKHPSLSRTTVYNTLDLLREKGIVQAVLITKKEVRYELVRGQHLHFYCKVCGALIEIVGDPPDHKDQLCDHEVDEFHMYYRGTCFKCLGKRSAGVKDK